MSVSSKIFLAAVLCAALAVAIYYATWHLKPGNGTPLTGGSSVSQPAPFDDITDSVDVLDVQNKLNALNASEDRAMKDFYAQEKALALKDKEAQERINRLRQQPGLDEEEFQRRYGAVLNSIQDK